jgi:hypothetical protein
MEPVHEAPRREVSFATTLVVHVLMTHKVPKHNSRCYVIARERDCFLQRNKGQKHEVCEKVHSKGDSGEIRRGKSPEEVGEWMVIVCNERVW